MNSQKTLIAVVGPTAIGKTAAAIKLAQHYQTSIISADSRQFYKEMSVGTAKPTTEEQKAAKHYFIDSCSITENYTAGDYEKDALAVINQVFKQTDLAIIAGGSGLFLKAVCEGFDELPTAKEGIREELNEHFAANGIEWLQEQLKAADSDYYNEVDINNPQRLIRALEVYQTTGQPFSSYRLANKTKRPFNIIKIGLNVPRELLYERINRRVDIMIDEGLLKEAESLLPYRHLNALQTVGYNEFFDYFDGKTDLPTAIELIKQHTRQFAKRQLTWFKKDKEIIWIDPLTDNIINVTDRLIKQINPAV